MDQMECENTLDSNSHKKGRHRKKQLYNSILHQMEFYFSDSNLSKDRFLSQLLLENPYIDLSIFLKFNKLRKLTTNLEDIKKAISKSELIELSEDGNSICRKTPFKVKTNVDECTIYVEKIKAEATHEWVTSVFAEFGNVTYVSIPKYRHNKVNKGFAFVEFDTEKEAENALEFFESIGSKMPSHLNPEELCSITTFEKEKDADTETLTDDESKKRKRCSTDSESKRTEHKKLKSDDESNPRENQEAISENEDVDGKKKKKHKKEHKKKNYIKEIGLQVLSKKEWKKMRNHYLDSQRKKMKEFKNHINKMRFSQQNYNDKNKNTTANLAENEQTEKTGESTPSNLEFVPGVIVKVELSEPCCDAKKLKNEIKTSAPNSIKFIDVPQPAGSEEIYVRFSDSSGAEAFSKQDGFGAKSVLEGKSEKVYWDKIQNDRKVKFNKTVKKQRGRDKLLKKAKKEMAQHIRFDEEST